VNDIDDLTKTDLTDNPAAPRSDLLVRVNASPPDWAKIILQPYGYEQERLIDYALSRYWSYSDSVNVQDIAGTAHPDYSGRSWLWLLNNGKRMKNLNLPLLASNPSYYFETSKKEPYMEFTQIDDKTYINKEGNHRTCIARFFFHYQGLTTLHGVKKESYLIDHHFKSLAETLEDVLKDKRIGYSLRIVKTAIERIDTGGWYRENYSLRAELEIIKSGWKGSLDASSMLEILIDSKRPLRGYFGRYKGVWG
jgi:hypothetical protein